MQTKHRIAAAMAALLVVAGALTFVAVAFLFSSDDESFCCTLNGEACSISTSCNVDEATCAACNGIWISESSLDTTSAPSPSRMLRTSMPVAAGPAATSVPTALAMPTAPTAFPTFSQAIPTQACAPAGSDGRAVTLALDGQPGDSVLLERSPQLCTLVKVDAARTQVQAIGRSYEGHAWEVSPGGPVALEISCDPTACAVVLPALDSGFSYELAAFYHDLPFRDQVARFLEQATYGPTRESIEAFPNSFAAWVRTQQDVVPLTSHREFYREHLNGRIEHSFGMGVTTEPCSSGSRYRRFAFIASDVFTALAIVTDPATGRKLLVKEGQILTVLETTTLTIGEDEANVEVEDGTYTVCRVHTPAAVGTAVGFQYPNVRGCNALQIDGVEIGNPAVFFDDNTTPTNPPISLDNHAFAMGTDNEVYLGVNPADPNCDLIPPQRGPNVYLVVGTWGGNHWLFDPRFKLETNTLENPLDDGGGGLVAQTRLNDEEMLDRRDGLYEAVCSNPHLNFLNEDHCKLSYEADACSPRDPPDAFFDLDGDSFEKIYQATGEGGEGTSYVYAVTGLRQGQFQVPYDPPCSPGQTSRWVPAEDCTPNSSQIHSTTNTVLSNLLSLANSDNMFMRDIAFPAVGVSCDPSDVNKYDFTINVDGACWLNVHQDHLQVFDFTAWVRQHPGGEANIQQFATATDPDRFRLSFPDWHGMDRWHGYSAEFRTELGRFGDSKRFSELPSELTTEDVGEALGASATLQTFGPTVVCGSPNEVKSIARNAGNTNSGAFSATTLVQRSESGLVAQRRVVWLAIALSGDDGLRQRVAWALSQILVISPGGFAQSGNQITEGWVTFYDIFVRNAFGSYRDVLKEVSYSPMMSQMLTYMENKSTDYLWRTRSRLEFADENYAREIMQLFSVGLVLLNNDGTPKLDENGKEILTYTNNQITEYARVWTGFRAAFARGNIEQFLSNVVDPMPVVKEWRDSFPKLGLRDWYVGDGVPLCSDLPDTHFLQPGATYILLGSIPSPRYHSEPSTWSADSRVSRTQLDSENSVLYQTLCNADSQGGRCKYESKVVLDSALACFGVECEIEAPVLVEVEPGIFYEYLRLPCAHEAFFSDGRALRTRDFEYSCGDPSAEVGAIACCNDASDTRFNPTFGRFTGELVSYSEAERFCSDAGLVVCGQAQGRTNDPWDNELEFWNPTWCSQKAKISLEGSVALVHSLPEDAVPEDTKILGQVREDTKSFFRVVWSDSVDDLLSDYNTMCESLGCERDSFDNLCLCTVEVKEAMGFDVSPSRDEVLTQLFRGAFSPDLYWGDHPVVSLGDGVKMHTRDGRFSVEAVFEVVDDAGITQYRKNLLSTVVIGNERDLQVSFRNPTHMISIQDSNVRDVHYETDAAIDHYFYHPNTAPFLASRFAQRFGISNPSPRYVDTVSTAFRSGLYVDADTGMVFGSGVYGDLGAMVAAVLLDRETRSIVLDADPAHGSLLEPLLRFVRLLKSLEFRPKSDRVYVTLADLSELIGQGAHALPDVFSFFLPEFKPRGPIGDSGLVCPECEVLTGPKLVHLLNGCVSLLKYGLDNVYGGFGAGGCCGSRSLGEYDFADGAVKYQPSGSLDAAGVIDDLATLLTSGRLSSEKRQLLQTIYEDYSGKEALINIQQAMITSPEFHTTGLARNTEEQRPALETSTPSSRPYKATIQIMLAGGWDSFNVLVPHVCEGQNAAGVSVDEQYQSVRGELALDQGERSLQIPADGQPCSTFVINQDLSIAKELYDEGSLLFFANAGVLTTSDMDKFNYNDRTEAKLFGHNTMQLENKLVDPFRTEPGTGILGRLADMLTNRGFSTNGFAIGNPSAALSPPTSSEAAVPIAMSASGSTKFNERPSSETFPLYEFASSLNKKTELYSSVFGETWSSEYKSGVDRADFFSDLLATTSVAQNWNAVGSNKVADALEVVARLMQTKDLRGADRDMYYLNAGSWDHHNDMKMRLAGELQQLNRALTIFVNELKSQGLWESVSIVVTSDFGRTMSRNGREGSDHAWGGHYMVLGGNVRGGRVLGDYPDDLMDTGRWSIGRGRYMPSTSWEAIWNGVCEWMGVETAAEIANILPNVDNISGGGFTSPFSGDDLFRTD